MQHSKASLQREVVDLTNQKNALLAREHEVDNCSCKTPEEKDRILKAVRRDLKDITERYASIIHILLGQTN